MKYLTVLSIFFSLFMVSNCIYFEFNYTQADHPKCIDRLRFVYYLREDFAEGFATISDKNEKTDEMEECQNIEFYQSDFTDDELAKIEEIKANKTIFALLSEDKALFYRDSSGQYNVTEGYGFQISFADFTPIIHMESLTNPCWIPPPPISPSTTTKRKTTTTTTTTAKPKAAELKQTLPPQTKCDIPTWVVIVFAIIVILFILALASALWFWSASLKLRDQLQLIKDTKKSQTVIPSTSLLAATTSQSNNSRKSKIFSETKNPIFDKDSTAQASSTTANEPIISTKVEIIPPGTEEEPLPSPLTTNASAAINKSEINPFSGANDVKSHISKSKSVFH